MLRSVVYWGSASRRALVLIDLVEIAHYTIFLVTKGLRSEAPMQNRM